MNKTKAQSPLVATRRAGQALDAVFCRWHARLIDAELVASCTPKNCPLQHAQTVYGCVEDPAHIVLLPGVTLADLRQAFGERDWPLFTDNLSALRSALNQLAVSRHPTGALPEKGAASRRVLLPHEGEPVGPLVGLSEFLTKTLAPSLAFIGLSEQETRAGLKSILSDIAPGNLEQGQLLCDFVQSHFQGFRLFAEQEPKSLRQGLPATHGSGLELLDLSLTHLNQLAQLVRCDPLRPELSQHRLQQKSLPAHNELSVTDGFQQTLTVSNSAAADLMMGAFLETLSPLGLTQEEESLQQIFSLLDTIPSAEPIEALLKIQRLLLSLIARHLGDPAFPLSEGADRNQLLVRYNKALTRRDKALNNWYTCRDGAAAGPHRALTSRR